jgi:tetratricopeptide (TPR) repeat protein
MRRSHKSKPRNRRSGRPVLVVGLLAIVAVAYCFKLTMRNRFPRSLSEVQYVPRPPGSVTFTKDVAPIIFNRCTGCHRPGQSAPFPLVTYAEVKKRARQIVEVTERRFMPPWLPEPGIVKYAEERILSATELGLLRQWAEDGAIEGSPEHLPPPTRWETGWQLGAPDLVIKMPEPYTLPAEGKDVYRNFAIPIPMDTARYVEAVEFRPGNPKVLHHAAMRIDRTRYSRQLDEREPGPGFSGMNLPETTEVPSGHFLNWQPGKLPYRAPPGLAWRLEPESDFIVQLHLHPSGKPELVQSEIGFYFTDRVPTNATYKIILDWPAIDIPPGATDYVIEDSYELPVDAQALTVFPHAHYLAKEMQAIATFPDGRRQWLLWIKNWDFNWQGDYRYAQPVALPRGTRLSMRFSYDNSTNNVRNPHRPPQRVLFGPQTTDEMGELWLQVLPRSQGDLALLARDYASKQMDKEIVVNQQRLRTNPDDPKAHLQIGKALMGLDRKSEAEQHLRSSIERQPEGDEAHYFLGVLYRLQNRLEAARREFEAVLRLNPDHFRAHGNLGWVLSTQGNALQAEQHFRAALQLNPRDAIARQGLDQLLGAGTQQR